jgi:hypothetical protein
VTRVCAFIYKTALRLYPTDYHARFAVEMRATFCEALGERRQTIPFTVAECGSVALGACREWLSKLTTDAATRGRSLPDCRAMRPVGVTPQEWAAGLEWIEHDDIDTNSDRAGCVEH